MAASEIGSLGVGATSFLSETEKNIEIEVEDEGRRRRRRELGKRNEGSKLGNTEPR